MNEREFDYINVIPFIDIMLVLLTIVLTTSTFIARGAIGVDLPKASSRQAEHAPSLAVDIDRTGALFIDARPATLESFCRTLEGLDRETPLLIRADRACTLQPFVDVMDAVRSRGFQRVSLQTESP